MQQNRRSNDHVKFFMNQNETERSSICVNVTVYLLFHAAKKVISRCRHTKGLREKDEKILLIYSFIERKAKVNG